jgi:hypothetical protein
MRARNRCRNRCQPNIWLAEHLGRFIARRAGETAFETQSLLDRAIERAQTALERLSSQEEQRLYLSDRHNVALYLTETGRHAEAAGLVIAAGLGALAAVLLSQEAARREEDHGGDGARVGGTARDGAARGRRGGGIGRDAPFGIPRPFRDVRPRNLALSRDRLAASRGQLAAKPIELAGKRTGLAASPSRLPASWPQLAVSSERLTATRARLAANRPGLPDNR